MQPNARRRLERLEERAAATRFAPGWSPEEMAKQAADELDFAFVTDSPVDLCGAELAALGIETPDELPEELHPLVQVRPPDWGTIRHRYKEPPPRPFEGWREKVREHDERVRAFESETKQRDRELLEDNRAACGLPPLASEQIAGWGLEGTRWEGEQG